MLKSAIHTSQVELSNLSATVEEKVEAAFQQNLQNATRI